MLPIDFIIIGGGPAGLCTAISLARIGHRVTLLEQGDDFDETAGAGGIKLAPNMSRIFNRWGLLDRLREFSTILRTVDILRFDTGAAIGKHTWVEEVMQELGGEFITLHYGDLRRVLKGVALEAGVTVRPNSQVTAISTDPSSRASVTLSSGETLAGDVLVGADGTFGISRRTLVGQEERPASMGIGVYNTIIPEERVRQNPELAHFLQEESTVSWFGSGRSAMAFPVRSDAFGNNITLQLVLPLDETLPTGWTKKVPPEVALKQLGECDMRLSELVKLAYSISCLPITQLESLPSWADQNSKLVLIGDAAHPIYPTSIQTTALCVADAGALSQLFRHLHHLDQIESLLKGFQEVCQERVSSVAQHEWTYLSMSTLSNGETQQSRDEKFKRKHEAGLNAFDIEGIDGDGYSNQWETVRKLFGADSEDEANEWWMRWGSLYERSRSRNISPGFQVEIQQEEISQN